MYLKEENKILREKLDRNGPTGSRQMLLSSDCAG